LRGLSDGHALQQLQTHVHHDTQVRVHTDMRVCMHTAAHTQGVRTVRHVQHRLSDCSLLLLVLRKLQRDSRAEMLVMDRRGGCLQTDCCECPHLPSFKVHLCGSGLAAVTDRSVWCPCVCMCVKTHCPCHLHQGKLAAVRQSARPDAWEVCWCAQHKAALEQ